VVVVDKLLLHVCCGPCASASIPAFRSDFAEVRGFFFNPNIHPFMEYRRRSTGAQEVAERTSIALMQDPSYDPTEWFARVAAGGGSADGGSRCARCISLRLERTAAAAAAQGCGAFSTTLSISPWQDHEAIRSGGSEAAQRYGVEFVYEDLRCLYPESRRLSRQWGVYRQKYCGCLVSEWERYRGR
jgi:predicted adenine nucleotide alpha hydrolase (AANH) superfamily ATPase